MWLSIIYLLKIKNILLGKKNSLLLFFKKIYKIEWYRKVKNEIWKKRISNMK